MSSEVSPWSTAEKTGAWVGDGGLEHQHESLEPVGYALGHHGVRNAAASNDREEEKESREQGFGQFLKLSIEKSGFGM